jgi:hypothetical protein
LDHAQKILDHALKIFGSHTSLMKPYKTSWIYFP